MKMMKTVVLGGVFLFVISGCSTISRSVRTYSPSSLTCDELREEWKNISDFDREATKRGTRDLGFGRIDSRRNDIKKAAREKKCKL